MSLFNLRGVWRISYLRLPFNQLPPVSQHFTSYSSFNNRTCQPWKKKPHQGWVSPSLLSLAWFAASSSSNQQGTDSDDDNDDNESKIKPHFRDLEDVYELRRRTLICKACGKRKIIQSKIEEIEYCTCSSPYFQLSDIDNEEALDWLPFLEQKDILVWRKAHPKLDGLFAYKMYGRFHDVSPREFLSAQLDISEFRKSWDTSTVECTALKETQGPERGSIDQVYYWEVAWPKFFANRDYVCQRSVRMSVDTGRIVVYTEAVQHPEYPRHNKEFRVENYFSILTIQSVKEGDLDAKGLEFTLTAFENLGLSLPTSITTWVAMRGLPQYIQDMRRACLQKKTHSIESLKSSRPSLEEGVTSSRKSSGNSSGCAYA
uniref:Phosphatidylcholine transfer protein n=1 Tax=Caligus clemensi TaxID=344056 RepID=C1C1H2_CALCM|nr:StAR-related lipid transfer protein 7 [Caligus clemensi]